MLANVRLTTLLPVVDLPSARAFYEEKLGVLGSEKAAWLSDSEGNIPCLHEDLA